MHMPENISSDVICDILRQAGHIILSADRGEDGDVRGVDDKDNIHAGVNFVTKYDREVQSFLFSALGKICPDAKFMGEEDGADKVDPYQGLCFIIDPIDGTANFVRDYKCSAISVALLENGTPIMGAIYLPYIDEIYYAEKGGGTRCFTGFLFERFRVFASHRPLAEGITTLGTSPYYKDELGKATVDLFETFLYHSSDVRRSGSAAYDFCCIASGRTDVFVEARLSPWDYAAGSLIVSEAGGHIARLDGRPLRFDRPSSVLATGRACYDEALALTKPISHTFGD